ncbi:MAG TPA: DUF892 family protein [Chthoniobacteraceae bacterium]|jgi:ferritin-like metal-binding protein YciE|nr:DUF892 family protein [Chthoniobacteraceae bacterium]
MKTQNNKSPGPSSLVEGLAEMHTAERELVVGLALLARIVNSKDFKTLLQTHRKETQGHVQVVEDVAESLGEELPSKSCKPVTRLIKEALTVVAKKWNSPDLDQSLGGVAQKIEQFEIDHYKKLCSLAKAARKQHEFALLSSILTQEEMAHELLGKIAIESQPLRKSVERVSLKRAKG